MKVGVTYLFAVAFGNNPKQQITQTGDKAKADIKRVQDEYAALDKLIESEKTKAVNDANSDLSAESKALKKASSRQTKFQQKQTAAIAAITKEAVNGQGDIQLGASEAAASTEDLISSVQSATSEFVSDLEGNTENAIEKTVAGTEKVIGTMDEAKEQAVQNLAGAADKVGEDTDELNGEIKDDEKEASLRAKDQLLAQKDIMKITAQNNKDLNKAESVVDKATNKLETLLDTASTGLDRMKTDAEKKATSEAGKSMTEVQKEFNVVSSETQAELKEFRKSNAQVQRGLMTEIDDAVKEGNANMEEAAKEAEDVEKAAVKDLGKAEGDLEKADEKMVNYQDKANDAASQDAEKLVETENALQQSFRKATAAATSYRNSMTTSTQNALEGFKESVAGAIKDSDSRVQSENEQRINQELGEFNEADKSVITATGNLQEASATLEEEVNTIKVEGQQAQSGIESLKGNIEAEEKRTEQMINEQKAESLESLKEGKANLQQEFEKAKGIVQETAGSAKQNVEAELKNVKGEMSKKISDDLEGRGTVALTNMQRTTSGIQQSVSELIAKMEAEQSAIEQKKKDVEGRIPATAEIITAAESGLEQTVEGVSKSIKEAAAEEEQSILAAQQKNQEGFTQQITEVENNIRSKTSKDAEVTERTTKTLQEEADSLKSSSNADFANEEKDMANLRQETTDALMRAKVVKEKADQESMALKDGIENVKGEINAVSQQEERKTKEMSLQLQSAVQEAFGTATAKTKTTIDDAMKGEQAMLTKSVQDAESGFKKDEMLAQEYSNQAETKLQKIGDDVEHLRQVLDKNKIQAVSEDQNLKSEMDGFKKQQVMMAEQEEKETASEREHIEQELRKMESGFTGQINQIQASEQDALGQVKQEASAYQADESDRLQVEKTKVEAAVKLHENRVQAQLKRIDGSVSKSQQTLKAFEEGENEAESKYGEKVSELDSHITTSDDSVNKAVRDEDQAVAGTMNDEIGDLEGIMGQLQGVEKGANGKISDMKATFKDELAYFASAGQAKSKELENKLKHVEDSSVDLVGEFKADTEASQNELAATQGRLGKVVNSTMEQMESFKQRLAEIRKSREQDAIGLHHDISDVKGELFNVLNGTTNVIELMKSDSEEAFKKMEREQKEFERMLVNASQMSSNHDDDKIQALSQAMYALESNHTRLMNWQKQFKHYTGAWREEVKRKLQELTGSVSSDEDQIAAGRLHSELSMQEGMRGLQKSVEGEVVDAVGKEAASVNSLVNSVRADMDNVFAKSDHEEEAKAQQLQMTKMELKNAQDASNSEMDKIKEAEGALNDKSNEFKNELAAAKDAISGTLVLPQESASEKNLEYNRRYTALQSKISQLESQTSGFLQTGERSFEVDAAGDAEVQQEVAALTALNAQLRSENAALSDEDDKLEARVVQIKQELQAAGVPENL